VLASLWTLEPPPAPGAERTVTVQSGKNWDAAMAAFEEQDKTAPPPKGAIVFTGASNFTRWKTMQAHFPAHRIINRGFGGSWMSDAVRYADRTVIPYAPRMVVLQAGGNDVARGRSVEAVAADFKSFTAKLRAALPAIRIAYLSIPANPARWDLRELNQRANALIREFIATQENMFYIDCWTPALNADGEPREELYAPDRLHVNAAGYKLYVSLLTPFLDEP
jgi:lysophospholipase L1-like esterase